MDEGKFGLTALSIGWLLDVPLEFCLDSHSDTSRSPDAEDTVDAAEYRILSSSVLGEDEPFLGVREG